MAEGDKTRKRLAKLQRRRTKSGWFTASGFVGALISMVVGIAVARTWIGDELTRWSYDLPFALPQGDVPQDVVLVTIDENTRNWLGVDDDQTLNRTFHAELLEILREYRCRLVLFDVLFEGPLNDVSANELFANAIRDSDNVFLAGELISNDDGGKQLRNTPFNMFLTNAVGWGLSQYFPHSDSAIREHYAYVTDIGTKEQVPTLAWAAAEHLKQNLPTMESANAGRHWIRYYGPPGVLTNVGLVDVLEDDGKLADLFRDRVVIVGQQLKTDVQGARKDEFATVYSRILDASANPLSAGMEIHATMLLNYLRGDWLTRIPLWCELALLVIIGLGAGLFLAAFKPQISILLALVGIGSVGGMNWVLHEFVSYWFAWLIPCTQIVVAWVWALGAYSIRSHVETQILQHTLGFYLPKSRARELQKDPELLRTHGEKKDVSFLFSDIQDFTTISDRTPPGQLFDTLNEYFQQMVPCIHETDGTVMQFVGDAIYAIWNAPEEQHDHASRALRAALAMRAQLVEFESSNQRFSFKTRVGLHAGSAFVGNCGSSERFEYAAIGKDTNLAARLEGLNKHLGTDILASEEILALTNDEFVIRPLGYFRLKGSDRVPGVAEVIGLKSEMPDPPSWIQVFADSVRHFQKAKWDDAEAGFKRVIAERNEDAPSLFYLKAIDRYCNVARDPKWFGEVEIEGK